MSENNQDIKHEDQAGDGLADVDTPNEEVSEEQDHSFMDPVHEDATEASESKSKPEKSSKASKLKGGKISLPKINVPNLPKFKKSHLMIVGVVIGVSAAGYAAYANGVGAVVGDFFEDDKPARQTNTELTSARSSSSSASNSRASIDVSEFSATRNTQVPPVNGLERNAALENQLFNRFKDLDQRLNEFKLAQSTYATQFKNNFDMVQNLAAKLNKIEGQLNMLAQRQIDKESSANGYSKTIIQNETNLSTLRAQVKDLATFVQSSSTDSGKSLAIIGNKIEDLGQTINKNASQAIANNKAISLLEQKIDQTDYRYKEAESVAYSDGVTITKPKQHTTADKIIKEFYFDVQLAEGYRIISTETGDGYHAFIGSHFDMPEYGVVTDYVEGQTLGESYLLTSGGYRLLGRSALQRELGNGLD